ncbi:MAG: InlB B-repeat-containing protein [Clostridia bacterium]|nr:InlB B-repeat-containing protein [Clostridia bacterium]
MKKKLLACLLAVMLTVSLMPLTAFAADDNTISEFEVTLTLPPVDGEETEVSEVTYEDEDGKQYKVNEQTNTPYINFNFEEIWEVEYDTAYAYVVTGADTYDCPFADDGYTFYEGSFVKGTEYIAAFNITLNKDSGYTFSDSLKVTVNDDAYYVKGYTLSPNNDNLSLTLYITTECDTANTIICHVIPDSPDEDYTLEITVPSGSESSKPEFDPERAGYNFTGWYANKKCTKAYEFGKKLTKDVEIYAGWEEAEIIETAELKFTPPTIKDEVKFVPTEIELAPDYTITADYPDLLPTITVNGKACEVANAYFLTGIPADPENGPEENEYFEGKFEAGKTYGVEVNLSSDSAVFAANEDIEITIPGAEEIVLSPDNTFGADYFTLYFSFKPNAEIYNVTEGKGQSVDPNSGKDLVFRIDADFSLFKNGGKVFIDETAVDKSNYKATEGSTVITFPAKYVSTLTPGEHTLKVVFSDGGEATANFTVEEPEVIAPTDYPTNTTLPLAFYPISIAALCGAAYILSKKEKEMA